MKHSWISLGIVLAGAGVAQAQSAAVFGKNEWALEQCEPMG
jgi:hypothetical protein